MNFERKRLKFSGYYLWHTCNATMKILVFTLYKPHMVKKMSDMLHVCYIFFNCIYNNHKLNYISHLEYVGIVLFFNLLLYIHDYIYYAYFPNLNADVCMDYSWLKFNDKNL